MLSSLWLRIGSIALCAIWFYAYGVKKEDTMISVFGITLPKVMVCSAASVIIMLTTGMLNALLGALLLFSLIGMPHMSLHTAPAGDAIDALELQPVTGYDSAA